MSDTELLKIASQYSIYDKMCKLLCSISSTTEILTEVAKLTNNKQCVDDMRNIFNLDEDTNIGFDIDAEMTTANAVQIDVSAMTTGTAFF